MSPSEILQRYWGFDSFRPMQEEIIRSVLTGTDTLAILPTGGGKSVCFQIPALALEGLCIVVTPLIALMDDQLQQLDKRGIPAAAIYAGMDFHAIRDTLQKAVAGTYKFLYLSPERLETGTFLDFLPHLPICMIAVDEAHCISQWGYDFRPSYLRIAALRQHRKAIPVLALTASATESVGQDIIFRLQLREPAVFRQSFERPNLSYSVFAVESRAARLTEIIQKVAGTAIVYCKTRKRTREMAALLQREGIAASFYHAGLSREERKDRQEKWIRNETRVMVCTNAFGMGIDKPDVRLVVHTDPPECLENYYQEAGRAGRDGKRSYAVLLYHASDLETFDQLAEQRYPPMSAIRQVYQALANYLQLPSGIGEENSYPVAIEVLCERFNLPLHVVINSFKAMQQGGILDYQEQLFTPSTVQISLQREEMASLEAILPETEPLIKALLRSYGGILEQPMAISERQLGRLLWLEENTIREQLFRLDRQGMIRYVPKTESPRVRFLQNRVKAEDLYIDPVEYLKRKAAFSERVTAMRTYITGDACRAAYIGRYFGDEKIRNCGICDQCLKHKKAGTSNTVEPALAEKLRALLIGGPLSVEEIRSRLTEIDKERILKILTHWEGEEKIRIMADGKISWVKKKGPG